MAKNKKNVAEKSDDKVIEADEDKVIEADVSEPDDKGYSVNDEDQLEIQSGLIAALQQEMIELRKKDIERDEELEELRRRVGPVKSDGDYVHPPGPWDKDEIGIDVIYEKGTMGRDEAARQAFDDLYDPALQGVKIQMATCGASMFISEEQYFPRHDTQCPCGRHHHKIIRFIREDRTAIIDEEKKNE